MLILLIIFVGIFVFLVIIFLNVIKEFIFINNKYFLFLCIFFIIFMVFLSRFLGFLFSDIFILMVRFVFNSVLVILIIL